jgi:hypothetical protein
MTDTSRIADLESSPIAYDENITLIGYTEKSVTLEKNQYYVLMVTDTINMGERPNSDYWRSQFGWVGLECTSLPERVYISKKFNSRHVPIRGITLIATVKDVSACCELDK